MSLVTFSNDNGVGRVTLARPQSLNAVNRALTEDLGAAVTAAEQDPGVNVILLTAEGRAFCAGADLKDPNTHNADSIVEHMAPGSGLDALAQCTKPVVAGVQGYCAGAGVEMVLSCDITIAATNAVFFLPQVALGIVPGAGGLSRLTRKVGPTWAARLSLLGERIDAARAERIGLVSEVVDPEQLDARASEIAAALAALPAGAVRLAKESVIEAGDLPLAAALRVDKYRLFALSDTEEKKASHAAFAQS